MNFTLKPETLAAIDRVITHYPQKRSATLPLLHLVQEEQGYISDEAVRWIAEKLELQPINVLEVVTFYPMFRQQPAGRRHVKVCRTLSCALDGGQRIGEQLAQEFGCRIGETSPDGEVHLEYVECLASCGSGPVVMIDDELYEHVDEAKARQLAAAIKAAAGTHNPKLETQNPKLSL